MCRDLLCESKRDWCGKRKHAAILSEMHRGEWPVELRCTDAGERNCSTSTARRAAREISKHSGGRICARRNAPYPGRKAWRAIPATGDCDRSLKGASGRSQVAAAQAWKDLPPNSGAGETRNQEGSKAAEVEAAIEKTIQGNLTRPQARGAFRCLPCESFAPRARICAETW